MVLFDDVAVNAVNNSLEPATSTKRGDAIRELRRRLRQFFKDILLQMCPLLQRTMARRATATGKIKRPGVEARQ